MIEFAALAALVLLIGVVAAQAGVILPTPIDYSFDDKLADDAELFSSSHCFSGNLQPTDGWRTNTCLLRNMCFNTTSKDFLFYAAANDQVEQLPDFVSLGTFNFKWSKQYDEVVKFQPKLVKGPVPTQGAVRFTAHSDLWLPYLPLAPSNIGHLIWDDYLPWFLLTRAAQLVWPQVRHIRPLWVNIPNNPPWATCDWIRQHEGPGHSLVSNYSQRCLKNNYKWLPLVLGPGQHVVPETASSFPFKEELVCFARSAVGITSFANQGSGHHGWNKGDGIPPAFGRASLLWEFVHHMRVNAGVTTKPRVVSKAKDLVTVLFSSKSSDRVQIDFTPLFDYYQARLRRRSELQSTSASKPYKVLLHHQVLHELSPREQIVLASHSCIYLTAAGGGAFTAQFLPRGASLVLFQDAASEHLHAGNVDWKFFNAASWIRTRFVDRSQATAYESISRLIDREVAKCVAFG